MEEFKTPGKRRKNPKKYLTVAEAAELMGLSEGAITWNIRKDFLEAEFDGYKYLIAPSALRRFMEVYYEDSEDDDDGD